MVVADQWLELGTHENRGCQPLTIGVYELSTAASRTLGEGERAAALTSDRVQRPCVTVPRAHDDRGRDMFVDVKAAWYT